MHRRKYSKPQFSVRDILYRTAGILLVLTILSACLLGGLYAKYVTSVSFSDSATVAGTGVEKLEVLEHEAVLIEDADEAVQSDSVYKLNNTEVKKNTYSAVLPGVDIPKDPFIRITGSPETTFELYVKIVGNNIPDTVTYAPTDDWIQDDKDTSTYKYKYDIDSTFDQTQIYILKDNKLEVKDSYVGDGDFSLTFDSWLVQKNVD